VYRDRQARVLHYKMRSLANASIHAEAVPNIEEVPRQPTHPIPPDSESTCPTIKLKTAGVDI
jgi:hypothetical protein